jgi:hypothetical protein
MMLFFFFQDDDEAEQNEQTTPSTRKAVQGEVLISVDKPLGVTLKARGGGIPACASTESPGTARKRG